MSIAPVPASALIPIDFVDCPSGANYSVGSGVQGTIYAGSTTQPQHGTLSFHAGLTGYVPNPGFVGLDHFDYLNPWTHEVWGTVYLTVGASATLSPDQYAVGITRVDAHDATALVPIGGTVGSGDPHPTISGVGAPGTLVTVKDGTTVVGTATADANGHWSLTPTQDLAIGDHALSANGSTPYPITRDWVRSSDENLVLVQDTTQAFSTADLIGDDTALGTATVSLKSIGTPTHGTVTTDASGNHVYKPAAGYVGTDSFSYTVADQSGHEKTQSVHVTVASRTQPPVLTDVVDDFGANRGPVNLGGATDDPTPTVSGTGAPGMAVTLYDNGLSVGTTTVDGQGHWTLQVPLDPAVTSHSLTPVGQALDGSGPTAASNLFDFTSLEAYTPMAVAQIVDNVGPRQGPLTRLMDVSDDPTPTLIGIGKPGTTLTITDVLTGTVWGSTTVDANTNWTLTPAALTTTGPHVLDIAYITPGSATVEHDTSTTYTYEPTQVSASGQPVIGGVYSLIDFRPFGVLQGGTTGAETIMVEGLGVPDTRVTVFDKGVLLGEAVVNHEGQWFYFPAGTPTDGPHTFTASPDSTGANASAPYTVTVQTGYVPPPLPDTGGTAVLAPVITDFLDDVGAHQGAFYPGGATNDTHPTLSGTGEPGSVVTLMEGTVQLGTATVGADWQWSITTSEALAVGTHNIVAVGAHPDGSGQTPSVYTYTFDVSADDSVSARPPVLAPVIVNFEDNVGAVQGGVLPYGVTDDTTPTFSGTAQPGTLVQLVDHGTTLGTATAGDDWQWSFTPDTELPNGAHSVLATGSYADGSGSTDAMYTFDFKVRSLDALLDSAGLPAEAATPATTPVAQASTTDLHAHAAQVSLQTTAMHDLAY